MASSTENRLLERGNIYFGYRPKIDVEVVRGMNDVQRLFMLLQPEPDRFRLIVIGRKKLPDNDPNQRYWGVVDIASDLAEPIRREFSEQEYETKTRGKRRQQAVRVIADGHYVLSQHEDHTHLVYELDEASSTALRSEMHIGRAGNYILTVKNPMRAAPPFYGAAYSGEADYPMHLRHKLGAYTFGPALPPELLDYKDAQIVLIGADHYHDLALDAQARDRVAPKFRLAAS